MDVRRCCPEDPEAKAEWEEDLANQLASLPSETKIDELSEILHALSHPIRLKIAFLLLNQDQCVCELVQITKKAPNLVSHHLMVMRKSGLVSSYMQSGEKYYKLQENIIPLLKDIENLNSK
ncbi:MAG: winged helix-turn-helix transcriptional regulator [Candidatus Helarchaeota archaeon]|nr:winged helix-turn-helix transcriptional regulator [Candidatus Helarchaeota archaeon]